MIIDVQDQISATQRAAKRSRKRAVELVDAAREVDLHTPAEAAKVAARRTAKRAAKRATAAASRAARRKAKRAGRHAIKRVAVFVLVAGAVAGVAVLVARRVRETSEPSETSEPDVGPIADLTGAHTESPAPASRY